MGAITSNDLLFKYTATATTVNPELGLGGTLNANTIPSGVANNIFDDVTGSESSLGAQEYRAIGIHNTVPDHVWMNTSIRVDGYDRAGANYDVIYFWTQKPAGAGGTPDGTIVTIASTTVAPAGASWTAEGSPSAYVACSGKDYTGSIGADDWAGIWLMRSVPASAAAYSNRSCTIRVQGETSASPLIYPVETVFKVEWTKDELKISKILGDIKADVC
jgi:hypothetical protein